MLSLLALALAFCSVTDGDTIRCGEERIRLLAIDAPELPGHCARGRNCVEGDPFASCSALRAAVQDRELTIERTGTEIAMAAPLVSSTQEKGLGGIDRPDRNGSRYSWRLMGEFVVLWASIVDLGWAAFRSHASVRF